MAQEHRRYFIELQPKDGRPVPRAQETEMRREQAADFIAHIGDWLRREALENKVASMAITALGQVQIICDTDIIHHLRHEDDMPIATIRNGSVYNHRHARASILTLGAVTSYAERPRDLAVPSNGPDSNLPELYAENGRH